MQLQSSDDNELMREVSAGSVRAFGELYDRFVLRAYGVAYSVCHDEARAQDAIREAFVSLWTSRTSYRPEQGSVAGWLLAVVRDRAIDLARRNGTPVAERASDVPVEGRPATDDMDATVIERDSTDRLRVLLARLPQNQQEVIALAYYGGLTHTEIAAQLQLPPGTVKGRMRLGLQKLRSGMNQTAA